MFQTLKGANLEFGITVRGAIRQKAIRDPIPLLAARAAGRILVFLRFGVDRTGLTF
jgi:hypothetical protein